MKQQRTGNKRQSGLMPVFFLSRDAMHEVIQTCERRLHFRDFKNQKRNLESWAKRKRKAGSIPKSVSQLTLPLDQEQWKTVTAMAQAYRGCKNYVYSRYSGIRSLSLVFDTGRFRKEVRDVWSGKDGFGSQWNLSARMRNLAMDDAKAGIKSNWSNAKNRVKEAIKRCQSITDEERGYLYYVLKCDSILEAILCRRPFEKTKAMEKCKIKEKKVHSLLCRLVRKYKGKVPYTRKLTFQLDPCMYSYKKEEDGLYLEFCTPVKNQRIRVKVRDNQIHGKTLTVVVHEDTRTLEIHALKKVKAKDISNSSKGKSLGVDKGYTDLLACSSGNIYGKGIHQLLEEETEAQDQKLRKRNRIYAQMKACEAAGDHKKAERIWKNNFGKKKWNEQRRKAKARLESEVNHSIRVMLEAEEPEEVMLEKLNFQSWHKKLACGIKRKLSRWTKGLLDKRLQYICSLYGIKVTYVNPAYTSQTCSVCGCLGQREGKSFSCPHCGHAEDADINASKNIKARAADPDIHLDTYYLEVKKVLEARTKAYTAAH